MYFGLVIGRIYCIKRCIQNCSAYYREAFISMQIPKGVALIKWKRLFEDVATSKYSNYSNKCRI